MKRARYDVIIAGSGFSGSVFAREMADAKKRVLILEKRAHIGGNMYEETRANGVRVHRYGPHFFHTNNQDVSDYLKRFSSWHTYEHNVAGKIDGNLVPIPFNFTSIEMLFDEHKASEIKSRLIAGFGENKRVSIYELLNADNDVVKEFGEFVFKKVFLNYTAKQWGIPVEQVDASTINRVPVVVGYDNKYFQDKIQMLPDNGYNAVFSNLLRHKNIDIQLNTDAADKLLFDFEKRQISFENEIFNGILFFTGAVDEFFGYNRGTLPYRSLNLIFEDIEAEYF
ncbi:MAG: NAD(P)-binding protein, partial [Treponema sp.]|nr:NAD(P)-binding protein [Treponema sp.]